MFLLGIAFSLVPAAMWPAVAKIVDENKIGTAYGLIFTIQNIGLWLFPLLTGILLDKLNPNISTEMISKGLAHYDYTIPLILFACLGILGLFFAFLLKKEDKISGFGLELPNKR
jgi:MFS family permease